MLRTMIQYLFDALLISMLLLASYIFLIISLGMDLFL